ALTGSGGWPMTCILTPDGTPFFAGTFFPREQFRRLLLAVARAWHEDRTAVVAAGARVTSALEQASRESASDLGAGVIDATQLDAAASRLAADFDRLHGGFGGAPKFPPSMVLEFLMRHFERTDDPVSLAMVDQTYEAMARGGMYDQLAGGFARYAVDADWVVPHFEKMLYDNALLLRGYLHWWRLTGSQLGKRVARETAEFLLRDLRTPEHGFASSLDADTDGVEGLTYVWTPAQLADVLGDDDGSYAAQLLTVPAGGTFEHGTSTLQLRQDPADAARWARIRTQLFEARQKRPQPHRDDKVVTSWNGLAIGALAEAGVLLGERNFLDAALDCGELMRRRHVVGGRLRRTSRDGVASEAAGVADDYGNLAEGWLVLHQATAEAVWLTWAGEILDVALERFSDGSGGFFDTADDAERLVQRPKDPADNATPSGQSALAQALLTYSALTGSLRHREAAERALRFVGSIGVSQPRFLGWALAGAEAAVAGPVEVAVVGDDPGLVEVAWRHRPPGAVVVAGTPDAAGVPLLQSRPLVGGQPAAYVCRGMVCDAPVTDVDELRAALSVA
ncbi:MAG: thioredoxin domain-containing protein, partial [Chloroflexi bacterium]|nr:thioredoxin domain-containing protein [Chloroflexota bacterium]